MAHRSLIIVSMFNPNRGDYGGRGGGRGGGGLGDGNYGGVGLEVIPTPSVDIVLITQKQ